MKLIIKEYLASLRERGELDAILPDLLSQIGMNVFSKPGRGTRQDGVDVGAVGKLGKGKEKVYLFAIKPGDLTRKEWAGGDVQDLRPSLLEILDAYIPNRLPAEHKDKEIVICICIGGDVQEQVRTSVEGFIKQHQKPNVTFEQWNGDKLAEVIQDKFLREDLLPQEARSRLRKSLAMLDEPDVSYEHFAALIRSLSKVDDANAAQRVRAIRQMGICLWILFAWGRQAGNMESAYRASELTLLHGWSVVRLYANKKNKTADAVFTAFQSILSAYQEISSEYLQKCVLPHVGTRDAISCAIRGSCSLDVNLKLFDILSRLAVKALWGRWHAERAADDAAAQELLLRAYEECASAVKGMIINNHALFLPIRDDQAIDVSIAAFLLAIDQRNHEDIRNWLLEMVNRGAFAYGRHGQYPCNVDSYTDLLDHPKKSDKEYRENVTRGTILYPLIALWGALLKLDGVQTSVAAFQTKSLQHCNFQAWYPDEDSESHFYTNSDSHGATLSGINTDQESEALRKQVLDECDHLPHFNELSAVKYGFWPLIVVACRHYRLPLPPHFLLAFRTSPAGDENSAAESNSAK